jgi:predicted HD phosphohydrolase
MTGAAKRKGDKAELEAAALLHDLLGVPARRKLGAGRRDDTGDICGVPDTTVQVVSRTTDVVAVGVVRKPIEAEQQAARAHTLHAVTMLRVRGGTWRMILTPDQWATLWTAAQ